MLEDGFQVVLGWELQAPRPDPSPSRCASCYTPIARNASYRSA